MWYNIINKIGGYIMNVKHISLIGKVFGDLKVVKEVEPHLKPNGNKDRRFLCTCTCGNEKIVGYNALTSGSTRSCGCLRSKLLSQNKSRSNTYEICGEITKVYDELGNIALIDTESLEVIKPYYFHKNNLGYFYCNKANLLLHRLITNCPNDKVVDHINHNRSDNRTINLRVCTQQENCRNKCAKGYCWNKKLGKWMAYIRVGGKRIHLGVFTNEQEAKLTYENAKIKYFGNFAFCT